MGPPSTPRKLGRTRHCRGVCGCVCEFVDLGPGAAPVQEVRAPEETLGQESHRSVERKRESDNTVFLCLFFNMINPQSLASFFSSKL